MRTSPDSRAVTLSAATVATGTFVSRILGAIRDAVIAAKFTLASTDAFFIAFTIPNSLRVLLGEGAISGAFVPVLSEVRQQRPHDYRRVYSALVGIMSVVLALVTAAGLLFAPAIVTLYAAGYLDDPSQFSLTVTLTRSVFPYVFLVGLSALATASLHTIGKFAWPALSPALLNIAMIACALLLPAYLNNSGMPAIVALSVGVLLGGVLQVVVLLPLLVRQGHIGLPTLNYREPAVRKALLLLVPLIAGLGTYQLNVMASRLLASFLETGAQSFLYYSQRLVEIPQGMIALAIGSATLPVMASHRSRGDHEAAAAAFSYAIRLCLFVTVPATIALIFFAYPTVSIVLGRGEFDALQVHETSRTLIAQAAGIWAIASIRTIVPAFHAHNDTRSPVLASGVNLLIFVGAAFLLMQPLRYVGIALAITLAAMAQLVSLLVMLKKHHGLRNKAGIVAAALRSLAASAPVAVILGGASAYFDWRGAGQDWQRMAIYLLLLTVAGVIYFAASWLLRSPELRELRDAVRLRATRK